MIRIPTAIKRSKKIVKSEKLSSTKRIIALVVITIILHLSCMVGATRALFTSLAKDGARGYILCIFLSFGLLITYNDVKCVILFRKYKKEQKAELQAEKDSVEEQRIKNEEMLKELMALKALLEQQTKTQESSENKEE